MLDYDIQARYDEFNQKYFGNELPKIPVSFAKLKNVGGHVSFQTHQFPGTRKDQSVIVHSSIRLKLSDAYKKTSENLDGILLHEMVHVYMLSVLENWKEHHGPVFMKKLREVSKQAGFPIPLKDSVDAFEPNIDKPKPYVVILFKSSSGYTYNLISSTTFTKDRQQLEMYCDLYNHRYKDEITIYYIKTMPWTAKALSARVQRKIKTRFRLQEKDYALISDLEKNGRILFRRP